MQYFHRKINYIVLTFIFKVMHQRTSCIFYEKMLRQLLMELLILRA